MGQSRYLSFPGGSEGKRTLQQCKQPEFSISRSGRAPGEGNGNPLQDSCLENPLGRGAWWAAVHGVMTKLLTLSLSFRFFSAEFGDGREHSISRCFLSHPPNPGPWNHHILRKQTYPPSHSPESASGRQQPEMCGPTRDLSQEKSLCSAESSQPPALWEGGSPDPQAKGLLSQNTEASQRDSSQGLWPADKSRGRLIGQACLFRSLTLETSDQLLVRL